MDVPRERNQRFVKANTLLTVIIPIIEVGSEPVPYTGVGVVKKVISKSDEPLMKVILQLDIVNPIQKSNQRQEVPKRYVHYKDTLSFSMKYDFG